MSTSTQATINELRRALDGVRATIGASESLRLWRSDPVAFSRAAGITPDPWQERVLQSKAPKMLLNCSRQSGKSVTAATVAAHTALFQAGSLTLIVSPSEHQSAETLLKVRRVLAAVGWPVAARAQGTTHVELANDSRVLALSANPKGTQRGYSAVSLLVVDEAAGVADDLMAAMAPVLAVSRGRLLAISTPWGSRGWWWQACVNRVLEGWEYVEVPATQCPRISADFLAEQRRARGNWHFEQEYLCRFMEPAGALFREEDIQALFHPELEAWDL